MHDLRRVVVIFIILIAFIKGSAQQVPAKMPGANLEQIVDNKVKDLFFAGIREKIKENYVAANSNFNKIISIDPANDATLFELAGIQYRQNKFAESEVFLKRAIAINNNNAWYYKLLAEIYKRSNNMASLVEVFNALIRLEPENENYYFDISNAWFLSGNTPEAIKSYDLLEKKFGNSTELSQARQRILMEGKAAPAGSEIDKLVAENPSDSKNYLYLSRVLLDKNKKSEAIELLIKAKGLFENDYEIDLAMADVYRSMQNNSKSFESLKAAFANSEMPLERKIKIITMMFPGFKTLEIRNNATELARLIEAKNLEDPKAIALLGDVLYVQGNLLKAKLQYLKVLKITQQIYTVWEELLNIHMSLGEFEEAVKLGEEALTIYPNQGILYYYLAFAQHRTGDNVKAASNIKFSLQLDADNKQLQALVYALQGEIFIDQNKQSAADEAFNKAVVLDPSNHLLLNNYAYYLALRGQNLNKALELITKAATAMPDDNSIADTHAFVLFKLEKYDLAATWIVKALQNNGDANPVYREHYGDILFQQGKIEQAVLEWQKARSAGNSDEKLIRKINEKKYIK